MKIQWKGIVLCLVIMLTACGQAKTPAEDANVEVEVLTWQEHYDLGVRYLSEGNYEEAIIAFTAAIEIDPKQETLYLNRGSVRILLQDFSGAESDFLKVIELNSSNYKAYLELSDLYLTKGDRIKAKDILELGYQQTNGSASIYEKWKTILIPISKIEIYDAGEVWQGTYQFSYDKKGRMIRKELYGYVRDGLILGGAYEGAEIDCVSWTTWVYDETSNTTTQKDEYYVSSWNSEPEVQPGVVGVYTPTDWEYSWSDHEVILMLISPYSLRNREMDGVVYRYEKDSERWDHAVFTYNEQGLVSKIDSYDNQDQLAGYAEITYVSQENI